MFEPAAEEEVDIFGVPVVADAPPPSAEETARRIAEREAAQPITSPPVSALAGVVDAVLAQTPADLPGPQALADAAELLRQIERLRVGALGRLSDVELRQLHVIDGASSTTSWVAAQQTSLDRGEVALARRMSSLPRLDQAVRDGQVSVAGAELVGKALAKLRRHVDRPDGLIDGQDGEQALVGVIGHGVRQLVCQAHAGFADDDPRLAELIADLAEIVESSVSQYARLEAAFVLLARHVEPVILPSALAPLVDALLPNELEKKSADAHANRGFGLRLNPDGDGWHVTAGELDLECGELLVAVLDAEMAVDPDNPVDTADYAQLRQDGWEGGDPLPEPGRPGPRSLRQRRHDALKNGLRRYLDAGIAGMRDKVAPHLDVIVGQDWLDEQPGALPAVSARTGARLPASLVRSWLADSSLARFVLSLGGKVIETSHRERTLKPHERRAKRIETGGWCQGSGCRSGPGRPLRPHHGTPWRKTGATSLSDSVAACDQTHHDIHSGGKTLRLRDGRWLDHEGWTDGPSG